MTKYSHLKSARLIGLSALAFALAPACSKDSESTGAPAGSSVKKAPEASATRVEVAILEGGTSASQIVRPGEVVGAREAKLGAALGGYVEKVLVESGDTVKKGEVIARVDTATHSAQLNLAKVELEDAERELKRLQALGKAVASARVDAAKTRVARAEAQRRVAATQLQRATIKAPFTGVLVDLSLEEGEVAPPGQPIGRLLVLDTVTVSVSVTDQDVGLLREGDRAVVSTAGTAKPLEGAISSIEPAANLQTRTFLVEVDVANTERRLLPGMIASVQFQPKERGETLLLPQDLLVTKLSENGVFVVDSDSTARWRKLELGDIVGSQVEVVSGVSRGEKLVSVGMRNLSEGDKVIVSRQGVCCRNGEVYFDSTAEKTPVKTEKADATPEKAEDSGKAARNGGAAQAPTAAAAASAPKASKGAAK